MHVEVTILLPCLNEEKTIGICIRQAAEFLKENGISGEIVVADNGSTDHSVAQANAEHARVVQYDKKGYGNILRYGIAAARGDYVIIGDSDCSYHFDDLMDFVKELRNGADLVMGNRMVLPMEKGAMPFWHRVGIPFLSWIGRCRYHCEVRDFHCGLRAVNKQHFQELECRSEGMEFATEMIGKAALANQTIVQLPVTLYRDQRGHKSHLRTFRDGLRHIHVMIKK